MRTGETERHKTWEKLVIGENEGVFIGWMVNEDRVKWKGLSKDKFKAIHRKININNHVMLVVRLTNNPELGERVIRENRLFTKKEVECVIDDLSSSLICNVNHIIALRKLIEIELRNVGEPCPIILQKCQDTVNGVVWYPYLFDYLIVQAGYDKAENYFWPMVLAKAVEKFDRLIHLYAADLGEIQIHYQFSLKLGKVPFLNFQEIFKPIPPKQALEDALKMLDYFRLIVDEISKTTTTSQLMQLEPIEFGVISQSSTYVETEIRDTDSRIPLTDTQKTILKGLVYYYDNNFDATCKLLNEHLENHHNFVNAKQTVSNNITILKRLGYVENPYLRKPKYIRLTEKGRNLFPPSS